MEEIKKYKPPCLVCGTTTNEHSKKCWKYYAQLIEEEKKTKEKQKNDPRT